MVSVPEFYFFLISGVLSNTPASWGVRKKSEIIPQTKKKWNPFTKQYLSSSTILFSVLYGYAQGRNISSFVVVMVNWLHISVTLSKLGCSILTSVQLNAARCIVIQWSCCPIVSTAEIRRASVKDCSLYLRICRQEYAGWEGLSVSTRPLTTRPFLLPLRLQA